MTPDKQQELLKRCLALQPLTGWPEWDVSAYTQLRLAYAGGRWRLQGKDKIDRGFGRAMLYVSNHEALCIWQDHLLRYLAERDGVQILCAPKSKPPWRVAVRVHLDYADTLIEALIDVCEQIQQLIKEQNNA